MWWNIVITASILAFLVSVVFLVWSLTRRLITVEDLNDAEWKLISVEFKLNRYYTTLVSSDLKLLYTKCVDSKSGEIQTRIEVSSNRVQGIVRIDIKGDNILVACASNINYPLLSCRWAYDLKNEIEKIINEHFRRLQ